uniref:Transmembrane protein n=1 Tax=Strongyloides stercoralis TaxID=6248 RepID=A0A0K0E2E9_STRER
MKSYIQLNSINSYNKVLENDKYILKKIKTLLVLFFVTACILTLFVFSQALFVLKREDMIKSLLHNNATIINGEWRFMFNKSNNEVGNCDIFKNLSLNNQNFVGQSSKEYIKIDHYRILKRTNLEGKKFTDCLLKYPRSISFQKFCLEQLGLTLINDIANALKNQEKNEATVIAYCIPKDYLHSIDKIYLLQAIGKHTLTIKSNVIDYFINYPIEITNQYSNCTFFEHFIKTYTIFNEKDKKKQKNRLKDIRHIKEELDKMCF